MILTINTFYLKLKHVRLTDTKHTGEAMGIGEIIIWNMGPIRDEEQEKDPNVPSVLCRMESHNGECGEISM